MGGLTSAFGGAIAPLEPPLNLADQNEIIKPTVNFLNEFVWSKKFI